MICTYFRHIFVELFLAVIFPLMSGDNLLVVEMMTDEVLTVVGGYPYVHLLHLL